MTVTKAEKEAKEAKEYDSALAKLSGAIKKLSKDDPSRSFAIAAMNNIVKMKENQIVSITKSIKTYIEQESDIPKPKLAKKERLPVSELTKGLAAIEGVIDESNRKEPEKLLNALEKLDNFEKTVANEQLKRNIRNLVIIVVTLFIIGAVISACPALALPISAAMSMSMPGFAGLITVKSVAVNVIGGIMIGAVVKTGFARLRESHYNDELKMLKETIGRMDATNPLVKAAKIAMNEIRSLKLSGDGSIQLKELTAGLSVINETLKKPDDFATLNKAIDSGVNLPASKLFKVCMGVTATAAVMAGIGIAFIPGGYLVGQAIVAAALPASMSFIMSGAVAPQMAVSGAAKLATMELIMPEAQKRSQRPVTDLRKHLAGTSQELTVLSDTKKNKITTVLQEFKKVVDPVKPSSALVLPRKL